MPAATMPTSRRLLWLVAAALAVVVVFTDVWTYHASFFDLKVYQAGANEVLGGTGRLYDFRYHSFGFTYPPIAALVLQPLALAPTGVLVWLWTALQLGCLVAVWKVTLRRSGWLLVAAVAGSALFLEPVIQSVRLGQVNVILMLIVLVDLLGPLNRRWRGLPTGLAAAFKLTPLVFLAFLALTRQWRALRNATIGFAGAAAVGFALLPAESTRYWTVLVRDTARIGPAERGNNQSVMGMLRRLGFDPGASSTTLVWLLVAGAFGIVALVLAAWCWNRGEALLAISLTGLVGLVASPVSWSHHWVWCIPLGLGLVSIGGRVAAALWWAVFVVAPQTHLPTSHGVELTWTPVQQVLGSTYLWASVLVLGYVAVRTAKLSRSDAYAGTFRVRTMNPR